MSGGELYPGHREQVAAEDAFLEARNIGAYTPAEVVVMREMLGLSQVQLARVMGVSKTAVERWEAGTRGISDDNAARLDDLHARAEREVEEALAMLADVPVHDRTFIIYRDDAHLRAHHPDAPLPASWIRAVAGRVRDAADFYVGVEFAP